MKFDIDLVLDVSVVERVLGRDADILDFTLNDEVVIRRRDINKLQDLSSRVAWKNKFTRRISKRNLFPNLIDNFDIEAAVKAKSNRGFFQTGDFFTKFDFIEQSAWFNLKQTSENFHQLRDQIIKSEPIAIHVRRGDYKNYKDSFGLLGVPYFVNGIEFLWREFGERPIWLFSDEPGEVIQDFNPFGIEITKIIFPDELSPAETLKLMSHGFAQVISNSTFSWWAAALSLSQRVVYPSPWFKENDGWLRSNNLALDKWQTIDALWK